MNTWRNASLALTAAAVLVLTTACGQDKGDGDTKSESVGAAGQAQPGSGAYGSSDGGSSAARPAGQLAARDTPKLGRVVTDSAGFTLYRFDKDTASPPKATCEGECAKAWPVVTAEGAAPAPGVDRSLLGTVTRSDGTKQLTIAGWPMYRFAQDTKPGDIKGQGVGGTWFASAPDGKKAAPGAAGDGQDADTGDGAGQDADTGDGDGTAARPGLSTRQDPKLGEIVVDRNGMTVYRFKKDTAWPMTTKCTGACLDKWPVVAPVAKNDTEGIRKKGYVTFKRPDGIQQQTIDCWPLYTFAGDSKPGDIKGQGVGGTWFAVSPQGKLVGAPR
ncbi:SCO0930 family lipoprotein [Streptomyces sp. NPDC000594]|uniref:SCO0930 family lipoprotein n=1 Tax=Streptomyces sp. NPDC000594 TaxID=3154261 RepID=UPI003323ADF2